MICYGVNVILAPIDIFCTLGNATCVIGQGQCWQIPLGPTDIANLYQMPIKGMHPTTGRNYTYTFLYGEQSLTWLI